MQGIPRPGYFQGRRGGLFPEQSADGAGWKVLFPVPAGIEPAEEGPVFVGLMPQGDGVLVGLAGQLLDGERIDQIVRLDHDAAEQMHMIAACGPVARQGGLAHSLPPDAVAEGRSRVPGPDLQLEAEPELEGFGEGVLNGMIRSEASSRLHVLAPLPLQRGPMAAVMRSEDMKGG